jgi:cysteine desulfurase
MKRIYLDHAAATPVDPRVREAMEPFLSERFANPSGIHEEARVAKASLDDARERIGRVIGAPAKSVIFTSGATESANLAIAGATRAWAERHPGRTPHLIVSSIEHDAVLAPVRELERAGARVTRLPVSGEGIVALSGLYEALTKDTALVAIMLANNEIGTIQPVADAARTIRRWKKEELGADRSARPNESESWPLLYSDASQAPNHLDTNVIALGVDLMTLSSGKIYGPKGIGLLYRSPRAPLSPILFGGEQEGGLRSGTENVAAIVGFARALEIAGELRASESERLSRLRTELRMQLEKEIPEAIMNGSFDARLPNNLSFSLPDVDHEFLAVALDAKGFAVATKSACSETEAEISHVLLALREGSGGDRPLSAIRVTLGRDTKAGDIAPFVHALREIKDTLLIPRFDR